MLIKNLKSTAILLQTWMHQPVMLKIFEENVNIFSHILNSLMKIVFLTKTCMNLCSYIILFLLQWQVYGITKKFVKKWIKIQSWAENIVGISRISMNFLFSNPSFICNDLIMEVLSDYVFEWLKRISLRM